MYVYIMRIKLVNTLQQNGTCLLKYYLFIEIERNVFIKLDLHIYKHAASTLIESGTFLIPSNLNIGLHKNVHIYIYIYYIYRNVYIVYTIYIEMYI